MNRRLTIWSLALHACIPACAQDLAPFTTPLDHFVVFDRGRFVELEPRKPQQVVVTRDRVVYTDDRGQLKIYSGEEVRTVDRNVGHDLLGSDGLVAYTTGPRLSLARATGPVVLSENASELSVGDSLVSYHDHMTGKLMLAWRNKVFQVADMVRTTDPPKWTTGRNIFTCFDRDTRSLQVFHRGKLTTLVDSLDAVRVALGSDLVAYFSHADQRFHVHHDMADQVLEEFQPIDFLAGDGLVAYTDATLNFKCWVRGRVTSLLDHAPTKYWVQDSVLLFVDRGMWWTMKDDVPEVIEPYVPEQWSVDGATVVYLDLNREVRSYRRGARKSVSREAAIGRFEHYGNAVLYRNELNILKVAWKGKIREY